MLRTLFRSLINKFQPSDPVIPQSPPVEVLPSGSITPVCNAIFSTEYRCKKSVEPLRIFVCARCKKPKPPLVKKYGYYWHKKCLAIAEVRVEIGGKKK